ncbi:MAG: hypothetical protein NVSMB12_13110 [Acidimicrobiales bacterium]
MLLDVGGVFLLPDVAMLRAALRPWLAEVSVDDLRRAHYAGIAAMDATAFAAATAALDEGRAVPTPDWPAYTRAMVGALGLAGDAGDAASRAVGEGMPGVRWSEMIPGALDALRRLADTGVAIGIVSNSDGTVEEQLLDARICQIGAGEGVPVTVLLDSHIVGIEKPDPAIFHRALTELGVAPEATVHVGDTGWADVVGARAAGVRPVHLDPYGDCPIPGDHDHVRDLDGIVALLAD